VQVRTCFFELCLAWQHVIVHDRFCFFFEPRVGSEGEMTPRLHQTKVARKNIFLLFFCVFGASA
jgi:hypothetical protein